MAKQFGSAKEEMGIMQEAKREHGEGQRETRDQGVKQEIKGIMEAPKDPGEHHMGGVHKSAMKGDMSRAVKHLEHQTERHEHAPEVGGHKHDHKTH